MNQHLLHVITIIHKLQGALFRFIFNCIPISLWVYHLHDPRILSVHNQFHHCTVNQFCQHYHIICARCTHIWPIVSLQTVPQKFKQSWKPCRSRWTCTCNYFWFLGLQLTKFFVKNELILESLTVSFFSLLNIVLGSYETF